LRSSTFLRVRILDAPVTFNGFSINSGATRTGGFVGSSGASLPSPPPRSMVSSSSQGTAAVPGVGLTISDFRGAAGAKVPKYSARAGVTVGDSDVTGVTIRLRPHTTLRGTLRAEPDTAKPPVQSPPRYFVFLDPASGQPGLGQPRASSSILENQEFEISGVQPAEYFLRVQGTAGWLVKSIQWQGRDYTTTPLDLGGTAEPSGVLVTVTNAVPTLFGTVHAQDGSVHESGLVIIFPVQLALRTNTGLWSPRMTSSPLGSNGTFRSTTLPAGEYFVAAIDRSRMATWRDPEFLTLIERQAARVTLAWGQTVGQDLTMAVVR
jgi:hypothetical protein